MPSTRFGSVSFLRPPRLGRLFGFRATSPSVSHRAPGWSSPESGDPGPFTYIRSRRGGTPIDRAVAHVFEHAAPDRDSIREFAPVGYDQRQYCSPGFDLPMGCLMRTPNGEYPEYHTSADNRDS